MCTEAVHLQIRYSRATRTIKKVSREGRVLKRKFDNPSAYTLKLPAHPHIPTFEEFSQLLWDWFIYTFDVNTAALSKEKRILWELLSDPYTKHLQSPYLTTFIPISITRNLDECMTTISDFFLLQQNKSHEKKEELPYEIMFPTYLWLVHF